MDFQEALAGLHERGRGRMLPDLSRITRLAHLLGDPQRAYPTVHVTGTNGKTSVTRMTATLLSAAGVSAGTYTSPHLQTVRERLSVAGRWIGQQAFADTYAQVEPLAAMVDEEIRASWSDPDTPPDRVTYFELLTAMAFWWFADKPVDVGILEVGMGGTWDATNLVRGDVAVLTPIDVDHRELGDRPVDIAREKSGIVKDGSIVVAGRQQDDVLDVIAAAAREHDAPLRRWGIDHEVLDRRIAVGGQYLTVRVGDREIGDVLLPVFGAHQADNAVLALAAARGVLGEAFDAMDDDLLRQGFLAMTSPGRLEVVHREPTVILDGAHNPHGARTAAAALREAFDFRHLVVVAACLRDKDLPGILRAYEGLANHVVVTTVDSPRAAPVADIAAAARDVWAGTGVVVETAGDVAEALELATGVAGPLDGVLVTGSLYTVGAARDRYLPVTDTGDEIVPEPDDDGEDDAAFQRAIDDMIDRLDGEA